MVLSIIVPFYNAAASLRNTLDALTQQSFTDIEIILVDDGSEDNGFIIANEIAKQDSRLKLVKQENKGVSSARNQGLKMALGSYVTFVDADDFVDLKMYDELMANVFEHNVDVCISGTKVNGTPLKDLPQNEKLLEGKKHIRKVLISGLLGSPENNFIIAPSACRLIIRTDLIVNNTIQFDTRLGYHEDFVFCIDLFLKVNRAYIDSRPFYNYIYNIAERNQRHKTLKKIESHKHIIRYLNDLKDIASDDLLVSINSGIIRFLIMTCENICQMHKKSLTDQIRFLRELHNEFKLNILWLMKSKNITLKGKIEYWLFSHEYFSLVVLICWLARKKQFLKLYL